MAVATSSSNIATATTSKYGWSDSSYLTAKPAVIGSITQAAIDAAMRESTPSPRTTVQPPVQEVTPATWEREQLAENERTRQTFINISTNAISKTSIRPSGKEWVTAGERQQLTEKKYGWSDTEFRGKPQEPTQPIDSRQTIYAKDVALSGLPPTISWAYKPEGAAWSLKEGLEYSKAAIVYEAKMLEERGSLSEGMEAAKRAAVRTPTAQDIAFEMDLSTIRGLKEAEPSVFEKLDIAVEQRKATYEATITKSDINIYIPTMHHITPTGMYPYEFPQTQKIKIGDYYVGDPLAYLEYLSARLIVSAISAINPLSYYELIKNPIGAVTGTIESFKSDPLATSLELYTVGKIFGKTYGRAASGAKDLIKSTELTKIKFSDIRSTIPELLVTDTERISGTKLLRAGVLGTQEFKITRYARPLEYISEKAPKGSVLSSLFVPEIKMVGKPIFETITGGKVKFKGISLKKPKVEMIFGKPALMERKTSFKGYANIEDITGKKRRLNIGGRAFSLKLAEKKVLPSGLILKRITPKSVFEIGMYIPEHMRILSLGKSKSLRGGKNIESASLSTARVFKDSALINAKSWGKLSKGKEFTSVLNIKHITEEKPIMFKQYGKGAKISLMGHLIPKGTFIPKTLTKGIIRKPEIAPQIMKTVTIPQEQILKSIPAITFTETILKEKPATKDIMILSYAGKTEQIPKVKKDLKFWSGNIFSEGEIFKEEKEEKQIIIPKIDVYYKTKPSQRQEQRIIFKQKEIYPDIPLVDIPLPEIPPPKISKIFPFSFTPEYAPKKAKKLPKEKIFGIPKTQYMPSLTALEFNIYGKKPKVISGLELRPLLKGKTKDIYTLK